MTAERRAFTLTDGVWRSARRLALAACLACGLALGAASAAQASEPAEIGSFGSSVLEAPSGVAADTSPDAAKGDLYVGEEGGGGRILRFKPSGQAPPAEAFVLDASFGNSGSIAVPGVNGNVAVDPTDGDLYALELGQVVKFDASGNRLPFSLSGGDASSGVPSYGTDKIAVDSTGHLYAVGSSGQSGFVDIYSSGGVFERKVSVPATDGFPPTAVAVDKSSDIFVMPSAEEAKSKVMDFGPAGELVTSTFAELSALGISLTIDPFGDLFAATYQRGILELDSAGTQLTAPGAGLCPPVACEGLAFENGVLYATKNINGGEQSIVMFGPFTPPTPTAATIKGESVSMVVPKGAHLEAAVDPQDLETTCTVEYGTTTSYGSSAPCPQSPFAGEFRNRLVSVQLEGLATETEYHLRVVARNSAGVTDGPDVTFTTPAPGPLVAGESSSELLPKSVHVAASVNPFELETTCTVEYGTTTSYGSSVPCVQSPLAAEFKEVPVSAQLTGLAPETEYHFRFAAQNSEAVKHGPDMTFTTPPPGALVSREVSSEVVPKAAHVSAEVNPEGGETTCMVEYGTTTSYGSSAPCAQSPLAAGQVNQPVSAQLEGLAPETEYHWRVAANNGEGAKHGQDKTFMTPPPGAQIGNEMLAVAGTLSASVGARVNPEGVETTCTVEYGTSASYGSSAPCEQSPLAPGAFRISVSAKLTGLQPFTEYHWRIVAANAEKTAYGEDETFATLGPFDLVPVAPSPVGAGELGVFGAPGFGGSSLAVDPNSGDVYVTNTFGGGVVRYLPDGKRDNSFEVSGLLFPLGVAVDPSSGDVYVATPLAPVYGPLFFGGAPSDYGAVYKFDASGKRVGSFGEGKGRIGSYGPEPGQFGEAPPYGTLPLGNVLAVGSEGDLYVADAGKHRVAVFDAEGRYLREVDGNGALDGTTGELNAPVSLAFGAGGALLIDDGYEVVKALDPASGAIVGRFDFKGSPQSISSDPSGNVLVGDWNGSAFQLLEFDPSGNRFGSFEAGSVGYASGIAFAPGTAGIAGTDQLYALDDFNGDIAVFGSPYGQPHAPFLADETASGVSFSGATLSAEVDPDLSEVSDCRFQYGTDSSYGQSAPCSALPATMVSGGAAVAVNATLSGLAPGAKYHFRVVATNAKGTVHGADETFTMSGAPPLAGTGVAQYVNETSALVTGSVDPGELDTTYQVQYGLTAEYGSSAPLAPADVGSGSSATGVLVSLAELDPGTTYHYRLVASNAAGTGYGRDMTFTTTGTPRTGAFAPFAVPATPLIAVEPSSSPPAAKSRGARTAPRRLVCRSRARRIHKAGSRRTAPRRCGRSAPRRHARHRRA